MELNEKIPAEKELGAAVKAWAIKHGGFNPDMFLVRANATDTWIERWDAPYPIPTEQELFDNLTIHRAKKPIWNAIRELEAQITERRKREAILTTEGKSWLEDIDAQIAALRAQL